MNENEPQTNDGWTDYLLYPEGLVGDIAKWMTESSGMYQPKFALAASLTACAALIGRGVKDYTGQRTNIYALAVGNTSAGKDGPIRLIQLLFHELGRDKIVRGEVTSDSALEILLDQFPVRLMLLDEIGHYFANIKTAGQSNGHLKTVMPMLTKAWSAASGTLHGKNRAENNNGKWQPGKTIAEPCVCVYGTTVPCVLFEAMNGGDFADGSIPRFLCFLSETRPRFAAKAEAALPEVLKTRIADALQKLHIPPHGAKAQDGKPADKPTPMKITETDEAAAVFEFLEDLKIRHLTEADRGKSEEYLWGKIVENARRIALTVAALRNSANPKVEEYDAKYAADLMIQLTHEFVKRVGQEVATNKVERNKKLVLRLLRQAGERGLTRSAITRATQSLRPMEREEILQDLEDGDEITASKIDTKTKPTWLYRIANGARK